MNLEDETVALAKIIDRLSDRFPDVPHPRVADVVWAEHHLLDGHPVRDFVPILVERGARGRLNHTAKPQ